MKYLNLIRLPFLIIINTKILIVVASLIIDLSDQEGSGILRNIVLATLLIWSVSLFYISIYILMRILQKRDFPISFSSCSPVLRVFLIASFPFGLFFLIGFNTKTWAKIFG